MEITLDFFDEAFTATAKIIPGTVTKTKEFSFILNDDLLISEIKCNEKTADYEASSPIRPEFRPLSKKISIRNEENIQCIEIKYSGTISFSLENRSCWHNIITSDIKSLSWYSCWYPQELSIEIKHDKVIILNGQDYFLVKGRYDERGKAWEYGDRGYDPYNIVLYRKKALQTVSKPFMNIYFIDDSIEKQADKSVALYHEIIDFYNGNLFPQKDIPVLDVACASPAITVGGGYRRKDLMWCTSLGDNDQEIAWLNAHETAHIWCSGADSGSWEDWLNETTAEWASLLFALNKNDDLLFDFILKPKLEKYKSLPAIRTSDGLRPEGVHDKGTVLFYEMYKLFGVETIAKTVRLFADLEHKNTFSLLQALYDINESDVADFIKNGITA